MTATAAAVLRTTEGVPVPLQQVEVRARLRDLLAEVTVQQSYHNAEAAPIEAVYTFPLPVDATLLDVEVTLGERSLRGRIAECQVAERDYEEAIVGGDAAVMIERPAPDLYTMNVGNLLPGARATVTFRYAVVLRWQRGQLRFVHPTTIAPRYGHSPLQPHQQPEVSLLADNACWLELEVAGMLACARFDSPSHEIEIERRGDAANVRLRRGRMLMDRDFVLNIRADEAPRAAVLCGTDLDGGYACLAAIHPDLPAHAAVPPRDLKIVVDCSGSMQGDSIAQARIAVQRILDMLRPEDRFNVVLFGSTHRSLTPTMVPGDDVTVARAQKEVLAAMADMGGTEMAAALEAAYQIPVRAESAATVVLITDGEIATAQNAIDAARRSGHRLFPIGVGSSVAEGLLRQLASVSGGACELVAPREDMAERIVRHFRRIDGAGAHFKVDWPIQPHEVIGTDDPVFDGDTVSVFARFHHPPAGDVRFTVILPDGGHVRETARIGRLTDSDAGAVSALARIGAARRLFELGSAIDAAMAPGRERLVRDAADLAVRYQLLSPWTNWLLIIAQQVDGAADLPKLRKVAHTLAAGWGGSGTVHAERGILRVLPVFCEDVRPYSFEMRERMPRAGGPPESKFSRALPTSDARRAEGPQAWQSLGRLLAERTSGPSGTFSRLIDGSRGIPVPRLDELATLPAVPAEVIDVLRRLVAQGVDEPQVVVAFLRLLLDGSERKSIDRSIRRIILKLHRDQRLPDALLERVRAVLSGTPAAGALIA